MKDLVARMKTANYRQLAIDHGEKGAAGVIGLFLLVALLTTSWAPYEKKPEELRQRVRAARTAIANGKWQDSKDAQSGFYSASAGLSTEEVQLLLNNDDDKRADLVIQQKDIYAYSTGMTPSVYRQLEPARQPKLLPAEDLLAIPGRGIIASMPARPAVDELAVKTDEPQNDIRERTVKPTFGGTAQEGDQYAQNAYNESDEMAAMGYGSGAQQARCMRYISVRGIVPLRQQVEKVAAALSESEFTAAGRVVYWDFRLERRSKPARGSQDWSDWEEVDLRTAREVLEQAASWDPEPVDIGVTDPVFTMQLPTRVVYNWSKAEVSHPRVYNYVLSPERRDRQMEIIGQVLDRQIEEAAMVQKQRPGGMALTQRSGSTRDSYSRMFGRGGMQSLDASNLLGQIAQDLDRNNASEVREELLKQIMDSQTASGRLLLFRYIDFDVKPATTYQYRVALTLLNPNYGRTPQQVENPEITRERYLETPMSDPTPEVTVPDDVRYFVTKVDDADTSTTPGATIDIYQWSTKYGTTINQQLKVLYGSFVGETTKAEVYDPPGRQYLEQAEVDFQTRDVLVDVFDAPRPVRADDHPDLGLPLEKLRRGLGVTEQALMVNQFGELVSIDPVSLKDDYDKTKQALKDERTDLGPLKAAAASADEGDASFEEYEQEFGAGGEAGGRSRGKARRNPLRKGSSRTSRTKADPKSKKGR